MKALRVLMAVAAVASTGCITYDRGWFAAVSMTAPPIAMTVVAENAEGRVCRDVFREPVRVAIDEALRSAPGANALMDVRYGFEQLCMVVRGKAVRID